MSRFNTVNAADYALIALYFGIVIAMFLPMIELIKSLSA